jgi:hypothetical protein
VIQHLRLPPCVVVRFGEREYVATILAMFEVRSPITNKDDDIAFVRYFNYKTDHDGVMTKFHKTVQCCRYVHLSNNDEYGFISPSGFVRPVSLIPHFPLHKYRFRVRVGDDGLQHFPYFFCVEPY